MSSLPLHELNAFRQVLDNDCKAEGNKWFTFNTTKVAVDLGCMPDIWDMGS